jgi:NADH-quinone oxidoreductase subunit F
VQEEVKASGLRGRGGAGFPTGLKWSFTPMGADSAAQVRDRQRRRDGAWNFQRPLSHGRKPSPAHRWLDLAAYANQADIAFIFIRSEYKLAQERLARAIAEAYSAGYLGADILSSGYALEMYLHVSAGRYMCGEETGLLNALEGKRANPRAKPPFPQVSGLWGKPTIVNNVETLANVPHIMSKRGSVVPGPEPHQRCRHQALRRERQSETARAMGTADGHHDARNPGRARGGNERWSWTFAVLPGGASTNFLVEQHLDVPMDYTEVEKAGSRLGTGTMIVLDDQTCPVGMTSNLIHFFAQESCGWCTPCWSGLNWANKSWKRWKRDMAKPGRPGEAFLSDEVLVSGHTFCALAPGAAEPLQSALKFFRDDFERHIREQHCPWRT